MAEKEGRALPDAATEMQRDYEPPRIESLGTISQLTMGFVIPGIPDNPSSFGSV